MRNELVNQKLLRLTVSQSEPPIGQKIIYLGSLCRGKSRQNIFHIFEGIDVETLAGFDYAHDGGSRFTAILGTSEEPVPPAQNQWFDAPLARIVANFNKGEVEVCQESLPAVERVCDCFSEFCLRRLKRPSFIEPNLKLIDFGFGNLLAHPMSLASGNFRCSSLDIKEAFDHSHWELSCDRIYFPCIFEVAVYMGPAICGCRAILDDVVIFIRAVGLQNSCETFENLLGIDRMLGVRIIVEDVGLSSISAVHPHDSFVRFTESAFNYRKGGGIRLNYVAFENERFHPLHDRREEFGYAFSPATHGGSIDRDTKRFKNLLLSVERKVQPEFIRRHFCEKSWSCGSLIDWLVGFLCSEDRSVAAFALVLEQDVVDVFEERLIKLDLTGRIKSDDFTRFSASRARYCGLFGTMFSVTRRDRRSWCRASTASLRLFDYVEFVFLAVEFGSSLFVNSFAGAGEEGGIYFGGFSAESVSVSATELFFELGYTSKQFADEGVASTEVVGKFIQVVDAGFGRLFGHDFCSSVITTLYSMHRQWYQGNG